MTQEPLLFGRAHADLTLSTEGGAVATSNAADGTWRAAASTMAMQSGRHFAQFTVLERRLMCFGVIRPGWDVEGGAGGVDEDSEEVDGHCFYYTYTGTRFPDNSNWEGRQPAKPGDRIGMLLELDQGSMTVWKNGVKLRVTQAEGLSGPLCWAVSLGMAGNSARIESALAPASLTEEELAAAKAWAVAHPY